MALQYYLVPNLMTGAPNDYMAVTLPGRAYTIEDVYDLIIRQGSTVTKAEALANWEEIAQGMMKLAKDGNNIITPLFNITPRVTGSFEGSDDSFDPSRHTIRLRVNLGPALKEVEKQIKAEKVATRERMTILVNFTDNNSDTQDDTLTPGGGGKLRGTLLKFNETDALQDVFFVNTATNAEVKVPTKMMKNKPCD